MKFISYFKATGFLTLSQLITFNSVRSPKETEAELHANEQLKMLDMVKVCKSMKKCNETPKEQKGRELLHAQSNIKPTQTHGEGICL